MDVATLIGLILAMGLIVGSILVGGSITAFIDVPSLLIVVGGTFAVGLVSYPLKEMLGSIKVAKHAFKASVPNAREQLKFLVQCAEVSRKEGVLALEKELQGVQDEFLRKGMQMLVDGIDAEKLREAMEDELYAMDDRHQTGSKIFATLGATAPAMGLIGTLIGLVQMLQSMDDPSKIGPAMAVALLTTFYGALFANVIFTPVSGKLMLRNAQEVLVRNIVIKGLVGIAQGENPRMLGQRLQGELSPGDREQE